MTTIQKFVVASLLLVGAVAQSDWMDVVVTEFLNKTETRGLALAAIAQTPDRGLQIWSNAYGYANLEQQVPMTPDTSFWLASVTKAVVAVGIMKAQEQGIIALDTNVAEVLANAGSFELGNSDTEHLTNITFADLADHRSTIVDSDAYDCSYFVGSRTGDYQLLFNLFELDNVCLATGSPVTLEGYLEAYLSSDGVYFDAANNFLPDARPGEEEEYSNIGAALCGYALSLAVGMPLDDYLSQEIFQPLGMEQTSFSASELDVVATPYQRLQATDPFQELPIYDLATFPDGGLRSSVNDMARFLGTIMNEGTLQMEGQDDVGILSFDSYVDLLTPRYLDSETGVFWNYLGLPVDETTTRLLVGHDGGDPGAVTFMFFDPDTQTGFFLAMNSADDSLAVEDLIPLANSLLRKADELVGVPTAAPSTQQPTAAPSEGTTEAPSGEPTDGSSAPRVESAVVVASWTFAMGLACFL